RGAVLERKARAAGLESPGEGRGEAPSQRHARLRPALEGGAQRLKQGHAGSFHKKTPLRRSEGGCKSSQWSRRAGLVPDHDLDLFGIDAEQFREARLVV